MSPELVFSWVLVGSVVSATCVTVNLAEGRLSRRPGEGLFWWGALSGILATLVIAASITITWGVAHAP